MGPLEIYALQKQEGSLYSFLTQRPLLKQQLLKLVVALV
jgi:hypothetical protein